MVALDNQHNGIPHHNSRPRAPRLGLPAMMAMAAAIAVSGGILAHGFTDNGFRLGSQLGWRFACLVLFAALVAGPLARLLAGTRFAFAEGKWVRDLVWSFAAAYAVYLVSLLVPNSLGREGLSPGLMVFAIMGGGVAAVMALMADPRARRVMGEPARRTLLGVAGIYFWLCYCLMALSHLSGPHRPDAFFGFSLCLMIAALLVRFAGRMMVARRPEMSAQPVSNLPA